MIFFYSLIVTMNVNRNLPTLSGQQNAQFDSVRATALAVTGTTSMGGPLEASSLIGGCITDSLTFSSSSVAASAAGLSNVAARVDLTKGGGIVGNLTVSGDVTCTGKYHGDGSLLTGISSGGGGGGGGGTGVAYTGTAYANNANANLIICTGADANDIDTASGINNVGKCVYIFNEPNNPFNYAGSNVNTSVIMADDNGNLSITAGNTLYLQSSAAVYIYSLEVGRLSVSAQNPGDFTINQYNPYNSTWVPTMSTTNTGNSTGTWTPIFNCANTQVTYKRIYFATTCTIVSDASIKTNVVPLPSALSFVDQLKPVSFNWSSNAMHNESDLAATNYGFIAQDVQSANSNLVEKMDNGLLSVNSIAMIPFLVKAVQELSAQVKLLTPA